MPNVQIPGVGVVQFPDTMDTDSINRASSALYAKAHGVGSQTPNRTGTPMFQNILAPQDRGAMGSGAVPVAPSDATSTQPRTPPAPPADWRDTALDVGVGLGSTGAGILAAPTGPVGATAIAGLTAADLSLLADMARTKMATPRAPGGLGEAMGNAGMNAALGSGFQGASEGLNLLRGPASRAMARASFPKNMPAAYEKSFGGLMPKPWEDMLSNSAFPPVGKSGAAGAKALESSAVAKTLEASNPRIYNPEDVLSRLDAEISRMERISSTPAADVAELKNLREQWINGNVPELPPPPTLYDQFGGVANPPQAPPPREIFGTDLPETKRFANRAAKNALQSTDTGAALRASAPNTALYNKALASQIRERLGKDVPGLMDQDAITRYWMAAQDALQAAEKAAPRPVSTSPLGLLTAAGGTLATHSPTGLAPWMSLAAYDVARNPSLLSAGAKALVSPVGEGAARAIPQVVKNAVVPTLGRTGKKRKTKISLLSAAQDTTQGGSR
jgi:hypothetical protein